MNKLIIFYNLAMFSSGVAGFWQNSHESISPEQVCINHIETYQIQYNLAVPNRLARAEHLQDLLRQSKNRFNLINDIYLHYRTIDDSTNALSQYIENCLAHLLHIPTQEKQFINALAERKSLKKMFIPSKLQDPVHRIIAAQVVNAQFLVINEQPLMQLIELDKRESSIVDNFHVEKTDFDNIFRQSWGNDQ